MKLVTQSWLRKTIFLFLGNTYGSLQDLLITLYMPHPQIVQKTKYIYSHRKRERKKRKFDVNHLWSIKSNAECTKTVTLQARVHHRYLKQRIHPKAQKQVALCAPAFIDLSGWIKVSSPTLEPSGANELSERGFQRAIKSLFLRGQESLGLPF